ncbi:MAG: hypothetical protein ACI9JN_000055 [Bacteroidia bacterium]|jgi:hypothetical protein
MKFKIAALIIGFMAIVTSCDDLSIINYDMDFATAELTIDATTSSDTSYVLESGLIDPKSEMEKNGVSADAIKNATLKTVQINLISPETGNFDWAKTAKVYITAEGQPETEVAGVDNVDLGIKVIDIAGLDIELTDYIKGGSFSFKLEATNDDVIPVDHTVTVTTTFNVEI